jgi:hypothetical protein
MRPAARQFTIRHAPEIPMREVLKSNNPVELNYAEALLRDAGIAAVVFDDHMSILDGSMVILPRRLMVGDESFAQARTLLSEGLKAFIAETPDQPDEA